MTRRHGPVPAGQACRNRRPCPDEVVAAGARRATAAKPVTPRRPVGLLVMVAALVLGIGSCQLPQPHLPKLLVGAGAGGGATMAVHRVPMQARSGPG